ncbi:hypothetical protein CIPAW_11G010500 [Carya illinoinensis]|uniref:Uncharacterized protein n=1 Tax=Carya illinoinensis TaxID=32201 RepID=A0A8T1NX22_CARIL|nr:hypothetical protein CIPAW_11G010500 [Carya illinoinensis]
MQLHPLRQFCCKHNYKIDNSARAIPLSLAVSRR